MSGEGGYSSLAGFAGGDGGKLQLNYHGLIRNFTIKTHFPILTGGRAISGVNGSNGQVILKRSTRSPRDVDVNDNGLVNVADIALIEALYRNTTTDNTFENGKDIDDSGVIDVLDLARVGFEINTR
ncbi:MAG: hypothetical protein A2904_02195 [Candidatus Staskawiczbacteria bacterium RIFCSPLOWO2_01_FULL_33_9]|uniref:Dockerin domain-containing protein n=1 Tax=Candidatus Staskawiczbacteria bacterium RIFCSPLOWO2_01_FULL_33_9 TaxID=1802211 RepID=A0A1G2I8X3_9BACT|nr:MAG: hypothetical protein A2904_02195 [Candidatus Staskawiczbacteria bacterium RIFCSPLOWO2_01_FULL_33_9]